MNQLLVNILDKLVHLDGIVSINKRNMPKIMQCLETLTEMIQGPCYSNQLDLTEGKFLDIITDILSGNDYL